MPATSEVSNEPASLPAPQPSRTTRKERRSVTGRVKVACDAMVYDGLSWEQAAAKAALHTRSMRYALERPHVIAYLKEQKQVFRTAVSSQNIHALAKLRDDSGNAMAQLGAIKVLEQIDNEPGNSAGVSRSPGFTIVVNLPQSLPQPQQDQRLKTVTAVMDSQRQPQTIEHRNTLTESVPRPEGGE